MIHALTETAANFKMIDYVLQVPVQHEASPVSCAEHPHNIFIAMLGCATRAQPSCTFFVAPCPSCLWPLFPSVGRLSEYSVRVHLVPSQELTSLNTGLSASHTRPP